jgi:hypothetical protein
VLGPDGSWERQLPGKGEKARGTQAMLMKRARQRARRRQDVRRAR